MKFVYLFVLVQENKPSDKDVVEENCKKKMKIFADY